MKVKSNLDLAVLILPWYKKNSRPMPWRETKDPYKIWVSEIMLQQTQVQTVIPYYKKWIKRFPDLNTLAAAPEGDVMKHWAGLGYYRRARMLHKAAQEILKQYGEKASLPSTAEELIKLPGIGPYTAGAIASIAFDQKTAILDGNVIRILTRIFGLNDDIAKPKTIQKLWGISKSVLPDKNIGDFNQAMMELGATVCSPKNPNCEICPAKKNCKAFALGAPEDFPVKSNREKIKKIKTAAFILKNNGKVLLEKQPANGRWGGLWMFPHGKTKQEVAQRFKIGENKGLKALTVSHGFTKYQVSLEVFELKLENSLCEKDQNWFKIEKLAEIPLPAPHKKIANHLTK